jgi:Ca2+-dependent lipid-binding protein
MQYGSVQDGQQGNFGTFIDTEDKEQVELFFSCRKLLDLDTMSKSDPQVRLYYKTKVGWKLTGKTEIIKDNLNPNFVKSICLDYIFEIQQFFKVHVVDVDDFKNDSNFDSIGEAEFELGELMGSKNNMLILN